MVASRSSAPAELDDDRADPVAQIRRAVEASISAHAAPGSRVAVAYSGGRDSAVLLDATAAVAPRLGVHVCAIHVHHGLLAEADAWQRRCEAHCATLDIATHVRRVRVPSPAREGIEAAARRLRYAAIAETAREARVDLVLLGHHQDDQAETLLLQLLRGAGPHGLCAMASFDAARGVAFARPLLAFPRAVIDAYVAGHAVPFVDDPSNADPRHRRNALRTRVAPLLRQMFPGYPATVARAAALQSECAALLDDLARIDVGADDFRELDRETLAALPDRRARNVLRMFLRAHGLRAPTGRTLREMLDQLAHARPDARVRLLHDGSEIGLHRGRVVVHPAPPPPFAIAWRGEPFLDLPHGRLAFVPAYGEGLAVDRIAGCDVVVRGREGGERMRLAANGVHRSVKHLLQEARVPAWSRPALPFVWCDGRLAAVAGVGIDVAWRAQPGRPGLVPAWHATLAEPPATSR